MPAKVIRRSSGTVTFDANVSFVNDLLAINTTDLTTTDPIITVNQGATLPGAGAGLEVDVSGSTVADIKYTKSGSNGKWTFTGEGTPTIDFSNAQFNNFSIGTIASINVTSNLASAGANITGGSIDGTAIGVTTQSTGAFTDLTASGTVSLGSHSGTLSGNSTGVHTGNIQAANTDVILNVTSAPALLTGQVSSIGNHTTTNLSEGTNLYYTDTRFDNRLATKTTDNLTEGSTNLYFTNTRADARIGASSINSLSDVTITSANTGESLVWNGSAWINQAQAQNTVNSTVDTDNSTAAITGATLQSEAASGLAVSINPASNSNKILITAHAKYQIQSSTGTTAFYIRLYRNKGTGGETLLAEDTVYESANTPVIYQSNFNVHDTPGGSATYSIYYDASTANGTLTPNPAHSDSSASQGYITATEVRITSLEIVEDTSPQLGGNLDAQTNKIINLGTPVSNTDAATKLYVDSQVQSKDTIGELNDVDTSSAVNNSVLKYNSSTSKWEVNTDTDTGLLNIIEDTTPQLGGPLDLATHDITGTGSINITGNGSFGGNVTVTGNLTVNGDTTTIDVSQLEVEDPMIYLNRNAGDGATNSVDSGILIERGSTEDHAGMIWQESADKFKFFTSNAITSTTTLVSNIALANIEANVATLKATSAQYADLAELYVTDNGEYPRGTVLVFGGDEEVTISTKSMDHRIAGVVSNEPAYLMNSAEEGITVPVALRGKVPVLVKGKVTKGNLIVTSDEPGVGEAYDGICNSIFVIGKSLENDDTENLSRLIYCVI